jgi:hypothetical protein
MAMDYVSLFGVLAVTIALGAEGAAAANSKYPDWKGNGSGWGLPVSIPRSPPAEGSNRH